MRVAAGEAHLWRASLDIAPGELARREALLSEDESARAARFRFASIRRHFVAAHGALRLVLSSYTGADPAEVALVAAEQGKPALAGGGLHFSLSHSGALALVAVSAEWQLGVDVELVRPSADLERAARDYFTPADRALLEAQPDASERTRMFFRLWTRREAVAKADGRGIGAGALEPPPWWSLFDVAPADGYAGALAVAGPCTRVRWFDAPQEVPGRP